MQIGDRISFIPSSFVRFDLNGMASKQIPVKVEGIVTEINLEHGWYRLKALIHGGKYVVRETFKIGE